MVSLTGIIIRSLSRSTTSCVASGEPIASQRAIDQNLSTKQVEIEVNIPSIWEDCSLLSSSSKPMSSARGTVSLYSMSVGICGIGSESSGSGPVHLSEVTLSPTLSPSAVAT